MLDVNFAAMAVCFPMLLRGCPVFSAESRGVRVLSAVVYVMNSVQMSPHVVGASLMLLQMVQKAFEWFVI